MPTLDEIDVVIAKEKVALRKLAEDRDRAISRGDGLGAMSIRHKIEDKARLVQRLQQERAWQVPVDQRSSSSSSYSSGSYFSSSNG
jgi:hypothetical protein